MGSELRVAFAELVEVQNDLCVDSCTVKKGTEMANLEYLPIEK